MFRTRSKRWGWSRVPSSRPGLWRCPSSAGVGGQPCRLARVDLVTAFGELGRLAVQVVEGSYQLVAGRLAVAGEPGGVQDVQVAQHRNDHLVVVDPQVVDAGHGDLDRLAAEVLDAVAGHLERPDDVAD